MCIGQEVHDTVVLRHWHTLAVGHHGGIKLAVCQDNALRIARSATGIKDIGNIVERSLLLQFVHLYLAWQVLAQLQEIAEIDGVRVVCGDMYLRVEHDDALQRRTK